MTHKTRFHDREGKRPPPLFDGFAALFTRRRRNAGEGPGLSRFTRHAHAEGRERSDTHTHTRHSARCRSHETICRKPPEEGGREVLDSDLCIRDDSCHRRPADGIPSGAPACTRLWSENYRGGSTEPTDGTVEGTCHADDGEAPPPRPHTGQTGVGVGRK